MIKESYAKSCYMKQGFPTVECIMFLMHLTQMKMKPILFVILQPKEITPLNFEKWFVLNPYFKAEEITDRPQIGHHITSATLTHS